jgi:hypothetical protein
MVYTSLVNSLNESSSNTAQIKALLAGEIGNLFGSASEFGCGCIQSDVHVE